jgi:hypothetical protein
VPRVSEHELREVVETKDDEKVVQFIDDANVLVNETLGINSGLSDDRLKLIEKYLAAHLFVLAYEKGGMFMEKKGESTNMYSRSEGEGLSSTRFGRLVATLDSTGKLNKVLSNVKKAQLRVV